MKKVIQTQTTLNRSMGIVKEMENIFRKQTRRGWLSYFSKPKPRRYDCYLGVYQGTQNKGKKTTISNTILAYHQIIKTRPQINLVWK